MNTRVRVLFCSMLLYFLALGVGMPAHSEEKPLAIGGKKAAIGSVVKVTDASFYKQVLQSKGPVVVDFWAPWCGACRYFRPIFDRTAKTLGGKIKFARLNIDENPQTAEIWRIEFIPTVILFRNGKEVRRESDTQSAQNLLESLR